MTSSLTGLLGDIPFRTHCNHHSDMKDAQALVAKRDIEIAELTAEIARLSTLLGAACASQPHKRLTLSWDDVAEYGTDPSLAVFGWRGELIVVQDHEYTPSDADELNVAVDRFLRENLDAALAAVEQGEPKTRSYHGTGLLARISKQNEPKTCCEHGQIRAHTWCPHNREIGTCDRWAQCPGPASQAEPAPEKP